MKSSRLEEDAAIQAIRNLFRLKKENKVIKDIMLKRY